MWQKVQKFLFFSLFLLCVCDLEFRFVMEVFCGDCDWMFDLWQRVHNEEPQNKIFLVRVRVVDGLGIGMHGGF